MFSSSIVAFSVCRRCAFEEGAEEEDAAVEVNVGFCCCGKREYRSDRKRADESGCCCCCEVAVGVGRRGSSFFKRVFFDFACCADTMTKSTIAGSDIPCIAMRESDTHVLRAGLFVAMLLYFK